MKTTRTTFLIIALSFFNTILANDTTKVKLNPGAYYAINSETAKDCKKIDEVVNIISDAIGIGAPTYNLGNHIGCYLIYEGAAYKILHLYGDKCKTLKNILEEALNKSYGDYTDTDKAWIMRMAFDEILGEPTRTN